MRKKSEILTRAVSMLLTLLLVAGTLTCVSLTAGAEKTSRTEKTYDIAVVFDNSGSMYGDGEPVKGLMSWSQAKYAMEIFASMLDFSKDKLTIYPMWKVTTDGSKSGGSHEGIEIKSKEDIDNKINKMYTPSPWETPFEPVKEAEGYLKASNASEKWLIVLTDGEFTQYKRDEEKLNTLKDREEPFVLRDELLKITDGDIKVQYLGFGKAAPVDPDTDRGFYSNKDSEGNVQEDLVNICNTIFQRIVLPADKLVGEKLTLDVSMEKVIVFAQGSEAEIGDLSGSEGDKAERLFNSGQRKYSNISAGTSIYVDSKNKTHKYDYSVAVPDESLAGQVVTFGECKAGEYTLDYTLGEKGTIQIFYEPDIDISVEFFDKDNKPVKFENGEILEGEYKIKTSIIDRKTQENILRDGHPGKELLGDVELITSYKYSDEEDSQYKVYAEYHTGDKIKDVEELETITLEPDKKLDIDISGHYLDYDIKDNNKIDLSWLWDINIREKVIPFEIKAEVLQEKAVYHHFPDNEWKEFKVTATIDGKPVTQEQFNSINFGFAFKDELEWEARSEGTTAYISISKNKNPTARTPVGEYEFIATATYTDPDGKTAQASSTVEFEIIKITKVIIKWFWIIVALIVLTLITLWLIHPVLPKKVIVAENDGPFTSNARVRGTFSMKGRYDVRTVVVSGKAKVIPKFRNSWIMSKLKPRRMNFRIIEISCSGTEDLTLDGVTYIAQNGKYYEPSGDELKSLTIGNSMVSWTESKGLFEGNTYINRR